MDCIEATADECVLASNTFRENSSIRDHIISTTFARECSLACRSAAMKGKTFLALDAPLDNVAKQKIKDLGFQYDNTPEKGPILRW